MAAKDHAEPLANPARVSKGDIMKRLFVLLSAGLLVAAVAAPAVAKPDKNPVRADWWVVDCGGTQYDATVLSIGRVGWPADWTPGPTP